MPSMTTRGITYSHYIS